MEQRNIKLTIAYDGSAYHGWQRQPAVYTVQEELENSLARLVGHPVNLRGAGRTDAGVHALAQVANFRTNTRVPDDKIAHALNSRLSDTVRIIHSCRVPDDFDAISWAQSKLYRYRVFLGLHRHPQERLYSWHVWRPTNVEHIRQGAKHLLGTHDFASFASAGHQRLTTVRNLFRCDIHQDLHWLDFELEADGFLYHMVRNIIGTLMEVGTGHWPPDRIADALAAKSRPAAGPMAPAQGLYLIWVRYPASSVPPTPPQV